MRRTRWNGLAALVLAAALLAATAPLHAQQRRVSINRARLTDAQLTALERRYPVRFVDGDYWYDGRAGLWGMWGGPVAGFAIPGVAVGGALTREASGGARTGVSINGRELHPADVAALRSIMTVLPGRFWLDASGWGGYEGGPAIFNLWSIAAQAQAASRGRSWIHRGPGGGMGSDGTCIYYIGGDVSASTGC